MTLSKEEQSSFDHYCSLSKALGKFLPLRTDPLGIFYTFLTCMPSGIPPVCTKVQI